MRSFAQPFQTYLLTNLTIVFIYQCERGFKCRAFPWNFVFLQTVIEGFGPAAVQPVEQDRKGQRRNPGSLEAAFGGRSDLIFLGQHISFIVQESEKSLGKMIPGGVGDMSLLKKAETSAKGRRPFYDQGRLVYEWEQSLDEVHLYLKPPEGAKAKDLDIKITPTTLTVGLKGKPPLFSAPTESTVNVDPSVWMIEDGELHILLVKMKKGEVWNAALKGHGGALDPFSQQEVQKKLMLERFQEENPGFDFSGATFSGNAPDPRTFMGGVSYK
ncbi:nuclear movement protein domain containing protein [Toxoplasma gondii GAB2-2007-GAL-DOM2]|uniref:Nuclear movement protein domain containing protein n=5 Tax=Toxoplasma gondii TaxID=5811 RepID=B9QLU3_TOXGV|nr:nuclear movement protein domain containing protein [Toxoplasma gondii VEG]KFG38261.1 nuclear movement protein domain containing protein [Toxoplasma gondii p89]KFG47646.1 nuclear movement protein domain containing protein [Toxoplasma gondii GAB2-2007-GAL-DOM2]KFG50904.1 nuclear movement protein domain containing protein [Toxoplasma gondii FOU]PUA88787.1 nuclear movement protein domain containing protein [Toxoplasma gondii TgCATBr9]